MGTFGPPTTAQNQSKSSLAVIQATTSHYSRNFNLPLFCDRGASIDIFSLTTAQMYGFWIRYKEGKNTNIYDVSGNNIKIVGFTIIYLHSARLRKPLKINIAENLGRDGEVILSLRTLRRMAAIPDVCPVIDKTKFAEWDLNIYSHFDTGFEDEVNKVIGEGAGSHNIACEVARQWLIKCHPKVFADELNGNSILNQTILPFQVIPSINYSNYLLQDILFLI